MTEQLTFSDTNFEAIAVSPFREMGAYEALWRRKGTTFRVLARQFAQCPGKLPSDFVPEDEALQYAEAVQDRFSEAGLSGYGVRVHGAGEYPSVLRDADYPIELLYYQGLVGSGSVGFCSSGRNPETNREGLAENQRGCEGIGSKRLHGGVRSRRRH